jgi:hypothetical protein
MEPSEQRVERERSSTAPSRRISQFSRPWERAEYQMIWLRVASRDWRTLAVVPAEDGMSTYEVATLLMTLGASHGESVGVFDFRDVKMNRAVDVIKDVERQLDRGERIVFATRSIRENLATIPLARAVDCVVLCVSIGSTSMGFATETVEQIGKDRFIGSIVVRAPQAEEDDKSVIELRRRLEARC